MMSNTKINDIPGIMRSRGWTQGAQLMDKWFNGPPLSKPFYVSPDLTTITIAWVLGFARARTVYDKMVNDKVWSNDNAKQVMADNFRKLGILKAYIKQSTKFPFNLTSLSAQDQHGLHTNHGKVGGYDLDGLTAALGHFSIYVTPLVGEIVPEGIGYLINVQKVAFHVMDSYDFEGSQYLGTWDVKDKSVSNTPPLPYDSNLGPDLAVFNVDFKEWRMANRKGGDFQVYSDVKVLSLNPPDSIWI
jgi:hypothetical protein